MRRVELHETFHGTAAGQVPNAKVLEERFELSERQAQCAALVRMGTQIQAIAEVLGIAISTLDSHLAELRQRFRCSTTVQLRALLTELIPDEELAAFHCWPSGVNAPEVVGTGDVALAARLRTCVSIEQGLHALKAALSPFGVGHIYYCFIPHSVHGALCNDVIDAFLAPKSIQEAFYKSGGLLGQPLAQNVFHAPTTIPIAPLTLEADSRALRDFHRACISDGATHLMALGFPSGPAFVGFACTIDANESVGISQIHEQSEFIRSFAVSAHAAMLTNGALAAKIRLTVKERNALSKVALGSRNSDIARQLGVSERSLTKLLASSRSKLNAKTNTEAAVKAALVNALVFL